MKQFKRILSFVLSATLILGLVVAPLGGVVKAVAVAQEQEDSSLTMHPFTGTANLIRETIEELRALGKTAEEKKVDEELVANVEKASGLSYGEVRSALFAGLTADYSAGQIDTSALGLDEELLSAVMTSVLSDNNLSTAVTNLTYTTVDGKVTRINYKISEGYASAMDALAAEGQDMAVSNLEFSAQKQTANELVLQKITLGGNRIMAEEGEPETDGETSTCEHHTVGSETRADYNSDGEILISDVQTFFNMVAKDEASDADDYNEDGNVNIADVQKFFNLVANEELVMSAEPQITFIWNEEPIKDTTPITDDDGNTVNGGLIYKHESGEVSQGILPNVYYELTGISFYCSECHQTVEITDPEELASYSQPMDIYVNLTSEDMTNPETKAVPAGDDPGFTEEEKQNWLLFTEMQVATYMDDTFYNGLTPVTDEDGNVVTDEDGNPVVMPTMDENGNPVGVYADQRDNGSAEVTYYYGVLSTFINDKVEYFGTPTDFWTSKNSEANPMAALKYLCNQDPNTDIPPAQMTMMVRDLPQAFMAYYWQYGNELIAMRDAAIAAMPAGLTEVQELLFLHDWLAENAVFDMGAMTATDENGNPKSDPIQMTTFGALLSKQLQDSYGDGYYGSLCPGYAAAYALLVQAANPEVYQTKYIDEDGNEQTRWATVEEVDENGGDLVDFVQVLFLVDTADASVAGEGFGGGWFNNVHYFNAVKLASPVPDGKNDDGDPVVDEDGNAWYYVDSCYDDIYIECLQQYRGESDGSVNHTYFMLSPQTMATLYGDNVERIDSLYDGYTYQQTDEKYQEDDEKYNPDDPDHLKYEKVENTDEFKYDDTSYEDSWFSGAVSKICNDGTNWYYVDGGSSSASYADMMANMDSSQSEGFDVSMNDMLHGNRVSVDDQDKLKVRPMGAPDYWEDESEDESEEEDASMSLFGNTKEDIYATVLFDYGTGVLNKLNLAATDENGAIVIAGQQTDMADALAEIVKEDFTFNEQYPALTHTVAVNGNQLYFNLSNDIFVCNTNGEGIAYFMEYNDVTYSSDGRPFTATSYTVDPEGNMTVSNKPIGAICIHKTYTPQYQSGTTEDGQQYQVFTGMATADILTVNIATNFSFTSAGSDVPDEQRYTVEAVNFNPDYQTYMENDQENDNSEFMWCAVIRDDIDLASLVTTGGSGTTVPATCTRPAYNDKRTSSGVITNRDVVAGSVPTGHDYHFNEAEGMYICEKCGLHATVIMEDTENGSVTISSVSSNGLDGIEYEGEDMGEPVTPVSTFREAESKDSGEITISVTPDEGYQVSKVEYTVLQKRYITIEDSNGGTITVEGIKVNKTGTYSGIAGSTITLKAEAAEDYTAGEPVVSYEVTAGEGDDAATETVTVEVTAGEEGTYTFVMPDADVTVTGAFTAVSEETEPGDPITTGSVSAGINAEEESDEPIEEPEEPVVEPVGPVYNEIGINENGEYVLNKESNTLVSIRVTFEKVHNVTVVTNSEDGSYGTAEADVAEAAAGTTVTVTVTPADGYEVDSITLKDAEGTEIDVVPVEGEANTYTFEMPDSDVTVTVTFKETVVEPVTYNISSGELPADASVTFTVDGDEVDKAVEGDEVTISVTPPTGQEVESITVKSEAGAEIDVVPVEGEANTYTFEMPASNVTVTVTFRETVVEPVTYTITVEPDSNGTVEADLEKAAAGTTVTVTVIPADGYEVDSITVKDAEGTVIDVVPVEGEANTYTFTMPASDVTVTVTFTEETVSPAPEPEE